MKGSTIAAGGLALALGLYFLSRDDEVDGPGPWIEGPGGKGKVYGPPGVQPGSVPPGAPADFNFAGNGIWFSPDCNWVIEGELFRPGDDFSINAIEPPGYAGYEEGQELAAVIAANPENTVAGFVDWFVTRLNYDGITAEFSAWMRDHHRARSLPQPTETEIGIMEVLLEQGLPTQCLGTDLGPGVVAWVEDFTMWLGLYLHEWHQEDIVFDPEIGV